MDEAAVRPRRAGAALSGGARTAEWPALAATGVSFVAAWVAYGILSHAGMALHDDVTEAYVWGQEFQLGYNQHPPFWAWVAGAWFLLFPNREWAFMLLAVVNAAVGLVGAWCLVGRFASGATRRAACLLLLCTPFYTFGSYKYNANAIFLSIWPWTLFFFLRALDSRRSRDGVLFGVMIGLAMLSKYFAVILVLTCLAASLLHARAREYWRSSSPWAAIVTAALLVLPHAAWLIANGAPPVRYALTTTGLDWRRRLAQCVLVPLAALGMQLAIPALIWLTRRRRPGDIVLGETRLLAALVLLPTLLTVGFGLFLGVRLSAAMLAGTFPLAPLFAMALIPGTDPARLVRWTSRIVVAGTSLALLSSPLKARFLREPTDADWNLPLREAAAEAEAVWHRSTGRPLAIVGGSKQFSNAAAFYSRDRPSGFLELEPALSPWVTPGRIRSGGLLALCLREDGPLDDGWCRDNVARLSTPNTTATRATVTHRAFGQVRGSSTLDIYVIPPER